MNRLKLYVAGAGAARFSLKDQIFFAKRLAFLINAGVPLIESLSIMREQVQGSRRGRLFDQLLADIASGQTLAKSFARFPKVFGEFTVSVVRVGEMSGTLSPNLTYLAEELRKKQVLRRKIISACIYPAVITLATFAITAFLMLYLFPKIMPIFASLKVELPLSTRIVMSMSGFLQEWGLALIVGIVVFVIAVVVTLKKSTFLRYHFHTLTLKIPLVGTLSKQYHLGNITRTLGVLLRSGLRLSDALPMTADVTKNLQYKKQVLALAQAVNRGERISTYLKAHRGYFPDIVIEMLAVGERSGTLEDSLMYLSELHEHEVDEFTKNLSTLIEPALMIVMGLLVGFIAVSIITPIYGITQNLRG